MLHITHVSKFGSYLKVFGQRHKDKVVHMECTVQRVIESLKQEPAPTLAQLDLRFIALGRRNNSDFGRCKITGCGSNGMVAVHFIDYGHDCQLPLSEIRLLGNFERPEFELLRTAQPLVIEFILSRVYGDFSPEHVATIRQELSSAPVNVISEDQYGSYAFFGISLNGHDYSKHLILRNIGFLTTTEEQKQIIQHVLKLSTSTSRVLPKNPTTSKPNLINIPESKQIILSHLASNQQRLMQPPSSTAVPNMPQQSMVYIPPDQSAAMYMHPSHPPPTQIYSGMSSPYTDSAVNTLNQPNFTRNPYAPQASATYSTPISTQPYYHKQQIPSDQTHVIPSFKSNELRAGVEYSVFCSYIEDGPNLFSVQLKSSEEDLDQMMSDLSNIPLQNLSQKPTIGMACIARYSEDKHLYRAVIMNIMPTNCQVVYIDYGNSELVTYSDIYEIPQEFLQHSIFGIRFALSGYKSLEPLSSEIKTYFKTIAMENELKLSVKPVDGPMFVQYCDLYYNGQSVLELLLNKMKECPTYAPHLPIVENEFVVIRYVESPKKFFVQQTRNVMKYDEMMDSLMIYCQTAPKLQKPQTGAACAATFNDDKDWYRVEILRIDDNKALIQFVDFGICNVSLISDLRSMSLDFLTLPRQAIECCLNGFEKIPTLSELARDQLELLAEDSSGRRRNFRTKIIDSLENSVLLVSLQDESVTPPMDLSIRMFQLSMPPKTFRYLEQHKFQKPAITDTFAQNQNVTNAVNKEMINSTMINDIPNGLKETVQQTHEPNEDNPNTTSKTSNWDENSSDKGDSNWNKENNDRSSNWNNENRSNTWQSKGFNSEISRNNTTSRSTNWDTTSRNNNTTRNTSNWDDTTANNPTNSNNNDTNDYDGNNKKSFRNDKREYANKSPNSQDDYRNNDRGNKWKNKDFTPKADSWKDTRNNDRGGSKWNDNKDNTTKGDRNAKFNRSNESWDESNSNQAWKKPEDSSQGYGSNNRSTTGDDDSWSNDRNQSKHSPDSGYNNNRKNDYGHSFRDKSSAYFNNKHIIPRFNKPNRFKGTENAYGKQNSYDNNRKDFTQSKRKFDKVEPILEFEQFFIFGDSIPEPLVPLNETRDVALSWWISPIEFYVYLKTNEPEYATLMGKIQKFYKSRESMSDNPLPDTYVIVKNNQDQLYYRAKVIAFNEQLNKFKVHFIDLGRKSIVHLDDIWPLESRFAKLEKMAIRCALNVSLNAMRQDIQNKIDSVIDPTKTISCEFIVTSNEMTIVNMFVEELNLKESLIEDGLVSNATDGFECSMLIGQIVLAHIVSVDSLAKFSVQIYGCDTIISCSYKDCTSADLSLSDDFRTYKGHVIPIRIDNVDTNNSLIVTPLIDLFGRGTITPICPCPILSTNTEVTVAYIESEIVLYVHICKNSNDLGQLLDDMYNFYEGKDIASCDELSISKLCAVKSVDENWYRSTIVSIIEDEANVKYLDYGNCEQVPLTNIKELDARFYKIPTLAIKIYLPLASADPDNKESLINELSSLTIENTLDMVVSEYYLHNCIADLMVNGTSVICSLRDKEMADYLDMNVIKSQIDLEPCVVLETKETSYSLQKRFTAFINHTDNPDRFFLQLQSDQDELYQLQDNLQIVAPSLPPLQDFSEGKLCIVKYSIDDLWYRAVIIDSDSEITSIQFIDYGNTDTITDNSLIKSMNEAFANEKRYSIPCALPLSPKDGNEWTDAACKLLQEISSDAIEFEYVRQNETKNFVRLFAGDRDIIQEFIDAEYAAPFDIIISGEKCYVSHINSLNDFYIQMEDDTNGLELISSYLANETQFDVLCELTEGVICTAQYTEDNQWYRASILHQLSDKTEVLFVDYGNTSFTTNIRKLPDEIAKLPYLSKRCSLRLPNGAEEWSVEANQKFHEIAGMGATVFTVNLVSWGDLASVDLLIDDVNIANDLFEFCNQKSMVSSKADIKRYDPLGKERTIEKGYFLSVTSCEDFYIQLEEEQNAISNMRNLLNKTLEFDRPEEIVIGDLYAVFNDDENSFYRGKILEEINEKEYKSILIDCGVVVISTDIRLLPETIANVNPLAVHCSLLKDKIVNVEEELTRFIIDNSNKLFEFEFDRTKQNPTIVSAYLNGIDIRNIIKNIRENDAINAEVGRDMYEEIMNSVCPNIKQNHSELIADKYIDEIIDSVIFQDNSSMIGKEICGGIIDTVIQKLDNHAMETSSLQNHNHEMSEMEAVYITIFNSSTDFYIQFNNQTENIKNMSEAMDSATDWPIFEDRQVGSVCAGLFDDTFYYRAEILDIISDTEFRVLFMDYGNEFITSDIRQIPFNLKAIEKFAVHCVLKEKISDSNQPKLLAFVNENISESYNILIHNCTTTPYIVSLFKDDTNITQLLKLNQSDPMEIIELSSSDSIGISNENEDTKVCKEIVDNLVANLP